MKKMSMLMTTRNTLLISALLLLNPAISGAKILTVYAPEKDGIPFEVKSPRPLLGSCIENHGMGNERSYMHYHQMFAEILCTVQVVTKDELAKAGLLQKNYGPRFAKRVSSPLPYNIGVFPFYLSPGFDLDVSGLHGPIEADQVGMVKFYGRCYGDPNKCNVSNLRINFDSIFPEILEGRIEFSEANYGPGAQPCTPADYVSGKCSTGGG